MKNIPRIFINEELESGKRIKMTSEQDHYLTRVMRTDKCLVFNDGVEFNAQILGSYFLILGSTNRPDPSNDITFCFAPIKKTDDMLNMVTQMGVAKLQPVITDRTVAHHVNWKRIEKIIIEASEQSNRNSVPELFPPQKFNEFLKEQKTGNLIFADERGTHDTNHAPRPTSHDKNRNAVFVGPEGGFSDSEFDALDKSDAVSLSLGKTILRAEVAAVAALSKILI